jgi:hypothetical protein
MTVGKTMALVTALVGAVAIGVAIGPTVQDKWSKTATPTASTAPTEAPDAEAPKPERRARPARVRETASRPDTLEERVKPGSIRTVAVSVWEPELRDRVKEVLMPGAKPEIAAEDFTSAEQFMTVAHAARNTQVPFMVLKHQVLNDGLTLAAAIDKFKPELDAKAEAQRARAAALADLKIAG